MGERSSAAKNRISGQFVGLFAEESAWGTTQVVYGTAQSTPSPSGLPWVGWTGGGSTFKSSSRPLSDVEFGALLEDLRGSIDRSAVVTQTVAAGVESLHKAIHASMKEVLVELRSDYRPRTLFMATLDSDRYRLVCPLPVEVSVDEEGIAAAQSPDLEQYGTGETEYEALDDLRHAIAESYTYFLEHEAELGPHPRTLLARYRQLIERKR